MREPPRGSTGPMLFAGSCGRVIERSFAWLARFRRLARDYERLPEVLKGLHLLAFTILFLKRFITAMAEYA